MPVWEFIWLLFESSYLCQARETMQRVPSGGKRCYESAGKSCNNKQAYNWSHTWGKRKNGVYIVSNVWARRERLKKSIRERQPKQKPISEEEWSWWGATRKHEYGDLTRTVFEFFGKMIQNGTEMTVPVIAMQMPTNLAALTVKQFKNVLTFIQLLISSLCLFFYKNI